MKSSLRFLGQELVVEGVIPADNAFNEAVYDEFIKIFGTDKKFGIFPSEMLLSFHSGYIPHYL